MSGNLVVNGFGRSGFWFWALAALSAFIATVLGAVISGVLLVFVAGDDPGRGVFLAMIAIVDSAANLLAFNDVVGVDDWRRCFGALGAVCPQISKAILNSK